MRLRVLLGTLGLSAASLMATPGAASACGGEFVPPSQDGDVTTDHRMIFRVSPSQTTLYDEIEYQGNPQSFAWVLPIHGQVQVGLSADIVFAALDAVTQTTIEGPPPPTCASCACDFGTAAPGASGSSGSSSGGGGGGVNVISQQVVGPYDTVQLQSTDPTALSDWLTANGFAIPSDVEPVVAAYVAGGFDFLALKLQPGQGVQAMRPVRVTTSGASLTLPLRMVAAGTGTTVGLTLWVIGDGRYEAQNFPNFTIAPSELTWDFDTNTSNYTTVQQQKEASGNFATWQTESSFQVSPYSVEGPVLQDDASADYLATPESDAGDGGAGTTADQSRQDDLAMLFPDADQGMVWITRMRADLARAALANDLELQASADQTELSNIYPVTQSVNAPVCPAVPDPCPPCDGVGGTSPGQQSSGCSAVPTEHGGAGLDLALAGLLGVSIVRSRVRKNKK